VLKRAAQQQYVAWLALAAMALIVLMPVFSRAMPGDMPMMGMNTGCGMDMAHMDMGHANHLHPGMPGHPDDPTARCSYCALLTHSPVASLGFAVLLAPIDLPTPAPQTLQPPSTVSAPLLSARPRGPPLLANG
jgi:hypothetical protein